MRSNRAAWCWALILMVGCAGAQDPRSAADEAKDRSLPKIARFEIEGNKRFSDQEIFTRIKTGPPPRISIKKRPRFDDVAFEVDLERIEALYRSVGYFSAKVVAHEVTPLGERRVKLKVVIEEGEPVHISAIHVKIENLDTLPPEVEAYVVGRSKPFPPEARLEASEEDSGIFVHENYLRAREELLARLLEKGYAQAKVKGEVKVDLEKNTAQVFLNADPGPLSTFGNVRFEGLTRISEEDLEDFITFAPGDRFDYQETVETKRSLFETGNFAAVTIEPKFTPGKPEVDVLIRVEEVAEHRVQMGGGAGFDSSGRADGHLRVNWLDRSFLEGMRKLQASGSLGLSLANETLAPLSDLSVLLSQPSFLANRQTLSTSVSLRVDAPSQNLLTITPKFRVGIDRDISRKIAGLTFGVGYSFQLVQLCFLSTEDDAFCASGGDLDIDALLALGLQGDRQSFRLGYLDQYIQLNRTDNPVDPRKGYVLSLNLHEGLGALAFQFGGGESFNYARLLTEARGYLPLLRNRNLVLAGRIQFGLLGPFTEERPSPFPERFFSGGATSHRGFGFQGLSPQERFTGGREAVAVGGDGLIFGSLELRADIPGLLRLTPIPGELRLAAFTDIGALGPQVGDLFPLRLPFDGVVDFGTLRPAVGGGIRYIYGPIIVRADVGVLLGAQLAGERNTVFHLSVGEAF